MGRKLSSVLRESNVDQGGVTIPRWGFQCPGCRCPHMLPLVKPPTGENNGPWTFSGDLEAPTIQPSVHVKHGELRDPLTGEVLAPAGSYCHATIANGVITFLDDSHGHKLRGSHPLPPFPHPEDLPPLPRLDLPAVHKPAPGAGFRKWRAAS